MAQSKEDVEEEKKQTILYQYSRSQWDYSDSAGQRQTDYNSRLFVTAFRQWGQPAAPFIRWAVNNFWVSWAEQCVAENLSIWLIWDFETEWLTPTQDCWQQPWWNFKH